MSGSAIVDDRRVENHHRLAGQDDASTRLARLIDVVGRAELWVARSVSEDI